MVRREYAIWFGLLSIALILAIILVLVQPAAPISPYAGDIFGSMIGFLLAISFAEIVKLHERINSARRTEDNILEEISEISDSIGKERGVLIPTDIWELAISTGDLVLLDPGRRKEFTLFYKSLRTLKWIQGTKEGFVVSGNQDTQFLAKWDIIEKELIEIMTFLAELFKMKESRSARTEKG